MDDDSPLLKPIKESFYERAEAHARSLQAQVEQGQLSLAEASEQLTRIMSHPEMMNAVIRGSQTNQATH